MKCLFLRFLESKRMILEIVVICCWIYDIHSPSIWCFSVSTFLTKCHHTPPVFSWRVWLVSISNLFPNRSFWNGLEIFHYISKLRLNFFWKRFEISMSDRWWICACAQSPFFRKKSVTFKFPIFPDMVLNWILCRWNLLANEVDWWRHQLGLLVIPGSSFCCVHYPAAAWWISCYHIITLSRAIAALCLSFSPCRNLRFQWKVSTIMQTIYLEKALRK